MTKVKGIETKQIVLEVFMGLCSLLCGVMMFCLYIEETRTFSFSKDNETLYQVLSYLLFLLGGIEFVNLFKKIGNYIEIYPEKIILQAYTDFKATKNAEIDYKDIKSVNKEKKGIIPWLIINTTTEQYKVNIKDVDRLIPIIKQKVGIK